MPKPRGRACERQEEEGGARGWAHSRCSGANQIVVEMTAAPTFCGVAQAWQTLAASLLRQVQSEHAHLLWCGAGLANVSRLAVEASAKRACPPFVVWRRPGKR